MIESSSKITLPVKFDRFSIVMSIISMALMVGLMVYSLYRGNVMAGNIIAAVMIMLCITGYFYAPASLSADSEDLCVHRASRTTVIALADVVSVQMLPLVHGVFRACGSGGWLGYWGWFYKRGEGFAFGYFGNPTNCFMVTLRNGRKYILGCVNPEQMVEFIAKRIK